MIPSPEESECNTLPPATAQRRKRVITVGLPVPVRSTLAPSLDRVPSIVYWLALLMFGITALLMRESGQLKVDADKHAGTRSRPYALVPLKDGASGLLSESRPTGKVNFSGSEHGTKNLTNASGLVTHYPELSNSSEVEILVIDGGAMLSDHTTPHFQINNSCHHAIHSTVAATGCFWCNYWHYVW